MQPSETVATACKERSVWKWRRQPTCACRRQQSLLDTYAAAAVLAVIIGCDDALEEIMIVQLARALQRFPFSQVERDQRAISCRSCRDKCCAGCVQTSPNQMISGSPISLLEPLLPLTPSNHCFLSISSLASACDERTREVSTHTSCLFVLFVKIRGACM